MVSHSKCHIVSHSDTDDSLRNSSDSITACSETELLYPLLVMTHLQSLNQKQDRYEQASSSSQISKLLVSVLRLLFRTSEVCSPTTKAMDANKDVRGDFTDGSESFKDPGRRGR